MIKWDITGVLSQSFISMLLHSVYVLGLTGGELFSSKNYSEFWVEFQARSLVKKIYIFMRAYCPNVLKS